MKVSVEQLQKIIREAVSRKLNETTEDVVNFDDYAEFLAESLIQHLNEEFDVVASDAFERMMGTLGDNVPVPARHEDVDAFSEKVVEKLLSLPDVRDLFHEMVVTMFRGAMAAK